MGSHILMPGSCFKFKLHFRLKSLLCIAASKANSNLANQLHFRLKSLLCIAASEANSNLANQPTKIAVKVQKSLWCT
jgi:hypothetical protein